MLRANRPASALALVLVGAVALAQATTPGPAAAAGAPASSGAATVQDLAAARKTALAALGKADFASILSGLADGLPPEDTIALISEYGPKVTDGPASKALLVRAGQLAVLLGDFSPAADLLEAAAFRLAGARDDALILQSARCRLAAGDSAKAADRASLVCKAAASPALILEAGIVSVWASLFDGDEASASAAAAQLLSTAPAASSAARELRFILWVAAPASERAARAADLAKAFPDSVEASIALSKAGAGAAGATGTAAPASLLPLPHWYLSGLLEGAPASVSPAPSSATKPTAMPQTQPPATIATQAAPSATTVPPQSATSTSVAPAPASQSSLARYQIGIFSDPHNADLLIAELTKKGFSAKAEKRVVGGRELIAVIVEGEADSLLLKLKDAGYEAYPLF